MCWRGNLKWSESDIQLLEAQGADITCKTIVHYEFHSVNMTETNPKVCFQANAPKIQSEAHAGGVARH